MLSPAGHTLRLASAPEDLFQICADRLPDIVLLDMNMGDHAGEQVLATLRERWPKLCVVIVTGYPSLDGMRATFKQQVFDYLSKPFATDDLLRVLAQAADNLGLGRSPQDRLRAELGRQMRLARTGRGWTLKELSEHAGVSVSQLSSVERGAHLPSLESLAAIAAALDAKPSVWLDAAGF